MKHSYPLAAALTLALGLAAASAARAQSVGIGTTTPNAAAALDITAAAKGLLIPRLDSATRVSIANAPAGLMVYQTTPRAGFYYYTGAAWVFIPDKARAGDNLGNHTATQNLNLQANALTGTGSSIGSAVGVGVRADGGLNLGQNTQGNSLYLGYQAGQSNTGSSNNVYLGVNSGLNSTSGSGNTFVGNSSGQTLTTGNDNTFTGFSSGVSTTTGASNVFLGARSGQRNLGGGSNTFVGSNAGDQNTTGSGNVLLGQSAGQANATGSNNVALGYNAGPNVDGLTNTVALGYNVKPTQSNTVILGNNAFVGIGTTTPGAPLDVNGSIWSRNTVRVDANDTNNGGLGNNAALYFGTTGSYEGIASKRTAGGNRYGLDFYTSNTNRLAITNGGLVGIGTTTPDRVLTVQAPGGSSELLSLRNNAGATRWHYNLYGPGDGLNLAESGVADFRLFVQPGGNVGLGTSAPTATLDVNGTARLRGLTTAGVVTTAADGTLSSAPASTLGDNLGNHLATQALTLNNNLLRLRTADDNNHGLTYNNTYDGPLLYGYSGGALGYTTNGTNITPVLRWTSANNVAIGLAGTNAGTGPDLSFGGAGYGEGIGSARATGSPNLFGLDFYTNGVRRLTIGQGGTVSVGVAGTNTGTAPDLAFGGSGTGEGIGSARSSGNPNQYGIDFYTGFSKRLSIDNNGRVGIGTSAPSSTLQVGGTVAVGVVRNLPGNSAGTKFSAYAATYFTLAPAQGADYYLLPAPASCPGRLYYVRNVTTDASGSSYPARSAYLGVEGGGNNIIDGADGTSLGSATYLLASNGSTKSVTIISDGAIWTVIRTGNAN